MMVEREAAQVQTGLRASESISGPGSRRTNIAEKWFQINHWALDVGNPHFIANQSEMTILLTFIKSFLVKGNEETKTIQDLWSDYCR